MKDSYYAIGDERDFVVFNDHELTMEPVTVDDLEPIEVPFGLPSASAAWSSGCDYYFVVRRDGIALLNVYTNRGFLCRKKSAKFIEMFLEAPRSKSQERRKTA